MSNIEMLYNIVYGPQIAEYKTLLNTYKISHFNVECFSESFYFDIKLTSF